MSVNKYDHSSGQLTTLANGQRTWIGTKDAYNAAKQAGTLPTDCLIAITDDSEDNNYSTEEKLTGKFWIDGKPIYRKVIDFGGLPNTEQKDVNHNISDMELVISAYGIASTGTVFLPIPYVSNGGSAGTDWVCLYVTTTRFQVRTFSNMTQYTKCFVVLEYTKTTD